LRSFHDGLPPGVPVPAWALKKDGHIHFTPSPASVRAALAAAASDEQPTGTGTSNASRQGVAGAGCRLCGPSEPIFYKGGTVQHNPVVHPIFWGSNWNGTEASKLREAMMRLFLGLSNSAWQGILTQYFDTTGYISSKVTVAPFTDERKPAPVELGGEKGDNLGPEVAEAITLQNKTAEAKGEAPWVREHDAQFVVFTAPGTTYSPSFGFGFCAFHTEDGAGSSITFVPGLINNEQFGGCGAEGGTSWLTSHEYAESATDPYFGGWKGAFENASEIGDVCEGRGFEALTSEDNLNGSIVQSLGDDNLESTCELSDPNPPHVLTFTEPATNVGVYEATLNGNAYPENLETSYRFEYGTTKKYGESISAGTVKAGSGFTLQAVHQVLPGLQQGATYHYRLAATDSSGTTHGVDQQFTVPVRRTGVLAWGGNRFGELGNGETTGPEQCGSLYTPPFGACSSLPVNVRGLSEVSAMAGGSSPVTETGLETGFVLALAGGAVDAWGSNRYGQLGNGIAVPAGGPRPEPTNSSVPEPVKEKEGKELRGVTAVAAGGGHSLALMSNGTVMAWGDNEVGELGNGTFSNSSVPVEVSGLTGVTAIAAAGRHSLALLANGTVMAWGENRFGELGNGTTTNSNVPVEVTGLKDATAIAAGSIVGSPSFGGGAAFSEALRSNGTVVTWGSNFVGQLGNGELEGKSTVPSEVHNLSEVTAIACGTAFSLALRKNGTVMGWGNDTDGQLGNGSPPIEVTTPVLALNLSEVVAIAAGGRHSLAVLRNGTLMTWGDNEFGELGDGQPTGFNTNKSVPEALTLVIGVTTIAAGTNFTAVDAPPPTVTNVKPHTGSSKGGTSVAITGAGFSVAKGVKFGSANAISFTVNSANSITAVSPPGAGTVDVTVTTPGITSPTSGADHFRYE
jgi:hypothetical protein